MNVELTRFKVSEGKSERVDEWLTFLKDNMDELEDGLVEENMYVETIFRETLNGVEYLYWYSVQVEGGMEITKNENWIAKKHLEYWGECIDPSYPFVDLTTEVVMIPKKVKSSMV